MRTQTVWLLAALSAVSFASSARVQSLTEGIPIYFEPNVGQFDPQVRFLARGAKYQAWITDQEMVLVFSRRVDSTEGPRNRPHELKAFTDPLKLAHEVIRIRFGLLTPKAAVGVDPLASHSNYFIGNDPKKWRSNVPNFSKAKLEEVYPGVDILFYGHGREIEYDFVVKPGADPREISLNFESREKPRRDSVGDVSIQTRFGTLIQRAPLAFQGEHVLQATAKFEGRWLRFDLGSYDRAKALTIDPLLEYSTFLGGTDYDGGRRLAVDTLGNAYIAGFTYSADFPTTPDTFDTTFNGGYSDVFLAKLNASGSALIYSTFLGGAGYDDVFGIAVDSSGNAYLTGGGSADFPTTPGAFATSFSGAGGIFVTKLNANGSALIYSSLWSGGGNDNAAGIAVDTFGNAYVTGSTASVGFPTTAGALATTFNGGCQSQCGFNDGFVAKLNASGSALTYSTFLGGTGNDEASGIAVDTWGNAYVTGLTSSADFPITSGAFDTSFNSGEFGDPFVAKLNPTGSGLVYSTFLGTAEYPGHIAIDTLGNAYVAGTTASAGFPTTPGAFDTSYNGGFTDVVATKLDAAGNGLIYSTFLGGNGWDVENGIAVDALGNAYIVGSTYSADFPTTPDAFNTSFSGTGQPFMSKLDSAGSLAYSTPLGIGNNYILGIAVETIGNAYVTGISSSASFPTTPGALDTSFSGGGGDVFIAKISSGGPADTTPPELIPRVNPVPNGAGWNNSDVTVSWTVSDPESGITSSTGCTATTLNTNTTGTTLSCSATNGAGLSNSASVTVKLDKTAPKIAPIVSPAPNGAGWNNSDVTVSWTVSDPESGITSSTGCTATTLNTNTTGTTLSCLATNGAGLSISASVTVKLDRTLPSVTFSGDGIYYVDQKVNVACSAADTFSGVASLTCATITSVPAYTCSATDTTSGVASLTCALITNVPAYTFSLGTNPFGATSADKAGNLGIGTTSFTVKVDYNSLINLVNLFETKPGVASNMVATLQGAQAAFASGNVNLGDNKLNSFIKDVSAQAGKSLTVAQAAILIQLARALMI